MHKCACIHVLFCISPINFFINKSLINMYPCSLILHITPSPFLIYSAKPELLLSLSSFKFSMLNLHFYLPFPSLSLSLSLSDLRINFCSLKQYLRPRKTFDNSPRQGVNICHLSIFVEVSK